MTENPTRSGRAKEIAARLLSIESRAQGTVKMKFNTLFIPFILADLKALGHPKPFLTAAEPFMIRTVLHNEPVLTRLLPSCVLAGPQDEEGQFKLWGGKGAYAGTAGVLAMIDFTRERNRNTLLVFDIRPFYTEIYDLLEVPKL